MRASSWKRAARAGAAAGLGMGAAWPAAAPAAIVNTTSNGTINVSGAALQGPPRQSPTEQHNYLGGPPAVTGLAPVHLTFSGHAEVPMATAASSASQDTSLTFNPASDFLQLTSFNSVVADTTVAPPTATLVGNAHAEAQSHFILHFNLTDHAYDYVITSGDFALNTQGPVTSGGFMNLNLTLNKGSPFEQDVFAHERLTDGTTRHAGSLAGTLAPGDYTFDVNLFGAISQGGGHADGRLNAGLLLKAAPPEIKWASAAGGSFQTGTNWDPQRVPGSSERAAFELAGNYTVTLDQDTTNDRLRVNGAGVNVTFDLAGHNYTVDQLNIGGRPGDSGRFTIKDSGGIAVSAAPSGGPRPAQAAAPATFTAASMNVKGGQAAELTTALVSNSVVISNGGAVNVNGAAARWTANSVLVGNSEGPGTLALSNKAALVTASGSILAGSTATVTGAGTNWTSDTLSVDGEGGPALLNVVSDGTLSFKTMELGRVNGGDGTLVADGAATTLTQSGTGVSVFGGSGRATVVVRNGAFFDAHDGALTIGQSSAGSGEVDVSARGALSVASLNVGTGGSGVLRLSDRATVNVSAGGRSGAAVVGASGLVAVNADSTFLSERSLRVDGVFSVNRVTGQAIIGDSLGAFARGKVFVTAGGTLSGTGTIFGNLALGGNVAFTGDLEPGNSPGTLTIAGDFEQQPFGVLHIQVAGTVPGRFDVLAITGDTAAGTVGDAIIGGDLSLEFLGGFAPHAGDRFDFLTAAGALTGQFQHVDVRNLAPGFQFDLRQENGHYALVALNDGVAVPEPGSAAPALALCALAAARRRRRRESNAA